MKVVSEIQDYREAITDFEETNNQLMNLKMNSVMQRLTTITFIVFPVTVIAELFMMNAPGTPIIGLSNAFWVIIGIMIVVSFSVYLYFKKRNLL
jgi:magnesium transporter